jgi:hypothetical protein
MEGHEQVEPKSAFLYGLVGGVAADGILFFLNLVGDRFPWELGSPQRPLKQRVAMYVARAVLYPLLGGFAAWTIAIGGETYDVIMAGLAGPAALMKYVAESREEESPERRRP